MAKVIISLPDELLVKVDVYCKENEYNRSEFIRHSMRAIISEKVLIEEDQDGDKPT